MRFERGYPHDWSDVDRKRHAAIMALKELAPAQEGDCVDVVDAFIDLVEAVGKEARDDG